MLSEDGSSRELLLINTIQVEHKRLGDSEKKSRGILGEKIESILHDVEDMLDYRENPESQKSIYEADEL